MKSVIVLLLALLSFPVSALTITSQPQSVLAEVGQTVTLSVTATSNRSIRYYWYKNGVMTSLKTKSISPKVTSTPVSYQCMVTDGKVSIRCNTVTVSPVVKKDASLNWTHATTRVDGSVLKEEEIAGYEVYRENGTASTLVQSIGRTTQTVIPGLASGSYEFALVTVDTKGLKSSKSPKVIINIP